jgi:hypothetical protein
MVDMKYETMIYMALVFLGICVLYGFGVGFGSIGLDGLTRYSPQIEESNGLYVRHSFDNSCGTGNTL